MTPMHSRVTSSFPSLLRRRLLRFGLALLFLMIMLFGSAQRIAPHAHADGGNVLYAPDLNAYPNASASSPRWIRLEHSGSANGTMLATFDNGNTFAHPYGDGFPQALLSIAVRLWDLLLLSLMLYITILSCNNQCSSRFRNNLVRVAIAYHQEHCFLWATMKLAM